MRVARSAHRHGVTGAAIFHAWTHAVAYFDLQDEQEPARGICIGPDAAGNLLEVLYLKLPDDDLIIHAMPLRPAFGTLLRGG